jgi:hypothetical protein
MRVLRTNGVLVRHAGCLVYHLEGIFEIIGRFYPEAGLVVVTWMELEDSK